MCSKNLHRKTDNIIKKLDEIIKNQPRPDERKPFLKKTFTKHSFIIVLFIVGTISMAYSTYNFAYTIPNLDRELSDVENDYFIRTLASINYRIDSTNGLILDSSISDTNNKPEKVNQSILTFHYVLIDLLYNAYQMNNGKEPTKEMIDKWDEMESRTQFDEELKKILKGYDYSFQNKEKTISKLKKDKEDLISYSIRVQILGLFLNQLAIILQFIWFKK